jgi:hypothetical protein
MPDCSFDVVYPVWICFQMDVQISSGCNVLADTAYIFWGYKRFSTRLAVAACVRLIKAWERAMSRFTDPMLLAREPGAIDKPRVAEGDFWSRMEASGVKVTRATPGDSAESIEADLKSVQK